MRRWIASCATSARDANTLRRTTTGVHFGVLGVHDLRAKMAEKGVAFARECRIYEVCNPHQAKKVLEANLEISTAMISLYPNPELRGVAEEVEATLAAIMNEAAG